MAHNKHGPGRSEITWDNCEFEFHQKWTCGLLITEPCRVLPNKNISNTSTKKKNPEKTSKNIFQKNGFQRSNP